MADTRVHWTYSITVSKEEFLLISKALRGNLKPEEMQAALELQEALVRQKHAVLQQALSESQKVISNIEERKI